jgi:hypothetical protein
MLADGLRRRTSRPTSGVPQALESARRPGCGGMRQRPCRPELAHDQTVVSPRGMASRPRCDVQGRCCVHLGGLSTMTRSSSRGGQCCRSRGSRCPWRCAVAGDPAAPPHLKFCVWYGPGKRARRCRSSPIEVRLAGRFGASVAAAFERRTDGKRPACGDRMHRSPHLGGSVWAQGLTVTTRSRRERSKTECSIVWYLRTDAAERPFPSSVALAVSTQRWISACRILPICLRLKVDEVLVEVGPVRRQAWRSPRAWTAAGRSRRSRRRSRLLGSGRARRPSRTLASSRWAAPSAVGGGDKPEQQLRAGVVQRRKPSSSMRTSSLRSRVSMRRPTELSATPR